MDHFEIVSSLPKSDPEICLCCNNRKDDTDPYRYCDATFQELKNAAAAGCFLCSVASEALSVYLDGLGSHEQPLDKIMVWAWKQELRLIFKSEEDEVTLEVFRDEGKDGASSPC
jgi:hypothetical protein